MVQLQLNITFVKLLLLNLIQAVTSVFPKLLRGSEEKFQMLLKGSNAVCDKMIEVLVKAGPHISVKLR